ncbi:MAG TPA: dTDP-4-dehydrorhamnose 3,5-epimerase [Aliidongia sp.]|nr:dTDP-4-dehydrorhamnose 3,5-epimerase [Aliidongia sp.]
MDIRPLAIKDVLLISPKRFQDNRGFFTELYSRRAFLAAGIATEFLQDNFSLSNEAGVVRGLHFQAPPFAQAKLLRVLRGAIFDVVVDIRYGSPTYGRSVSITLTGDSYDQLYVPEGFAHGFCTLEPHTEITYKVNAYYAPKHDYGLLWNDPALDIDWPIDPEKAVTSERDQRHPRLADLPRHFEYPVGQFPSAKDQLVAPL